MSYLVCPLVHTSYILHTLNMIPWPKNSLHRLQIHDIVKKKKGSFWIADIIFRTNKLRWYLSKLTKKANLSSCLTSPPTFHSPSVVQTFPLNHIVANLYKTEETITKQMIELLSCLTTEHVGETNATMSQVMYIKICKWNSNQTYFFFSCHEFAVVTLPRQAEFSL